MQPMCIFKLKFRNWISIWEISNQTVISKKLNFEVNF